MTGSYLVVFEKVAEDNWGAFTLDIPGAVGAGESLEQARISVREGLQIQLEDLAERGLPVPESSTSLNFAEFDPERTQTQYVVEWLSVEVPDTASYMHEAHQAA